jgi:hypothetical protein
LFYGFIAFQWSNHSFSSSSGSISTINEQSGLSDSNYCSYADEDPTLSEFYYYSSSTSSSSTSSTSSTSFSSFSSTTFSSFSSSIYSPSSSTTSH